MVLYRWEGFLAICCLASAFSVPGLPPTPKEAAVGAWDQVAGSHFVRTMTPRKRVCVPDASVFQDVGVICGRASIASDSSVCDVVWTRVSHASASPTVVVNSISVSNASAPSEQDGTVATSENVCVRTTRDVCSYDAVVLNYAWTVNGGVGPESVSGASPRLSANSLIVRAASSSLRASLCPTSLHIGEDGQLTWGVDP
jgi:hypothetical protein